MKRYYPKKEPSIPFTREGYDKILNEQKMLQAERPDAVENLRKAREMGDLSENGYYKAARARLSFLDARLRRLERLVRLGVVVESGGGQTVQIGSRVTVNDGNLDYEYAIVGGYESNPQEKSISHVSPIGRALIGHVVGDQISVVIPRGEVKYTIKKIG